MNVDPETEPPADELRMIVAPDKVLQLKKGLERERDRMSHWLNANRRRMVDIPPPASDPCSIDTMRLMSQNGQQAVDACETYVQRLTDLANKLGETAKSYGLVEDENANSFRQDPR